MKKAILFSLVAGCGLMFGQDMQSREVQSPDMKTNTEMQSTSKISGYDRIALETSSPRVHVGKKNKTGRHDRVVEDKTTINAFVPVGK